MEVRVEMRQHFYSITLGLSEFCAYSISRRFRFTYLSKTILAAFILLSSSNFLDCNASVACFVASSELAIPEITWLRHSPEQLLHRIGPSTGNRMLVVVGEKIGDVVLFLPYMQ